VQIHDVKDLEDLFEGLDITKYFIHFLPTCVPYYLELAAIFVAYCEQQNIDKSKLKVNFGFDITPYIVRYGMLMHPVELLFENMAALCKLSNETGAGVSAISVDGCTYHNSGASATQELAFSFNAAVCYIKTLMVKGFSIDEAARNIHFNFGAGSKFFIEIAKLRAARVI
jgi:methylmalonyl-CoA mutase